MSYAISQGRLSAAVYTLGCKLNQLESESIAHAFREEGFDLTPWKDGKTPDNSKWNDNSILIINTCTVTSKSEQKARRLIRKALRDCPGTVVIVTGCYAQMEAESLESLSANTKRLFVIPGERKNRILELPRLLASEGIASSNTTLHDLTALLGSWAAGEDCPAGDSSFCFKPLDFSFHSRAFLKIQDGCDNNCSFCRVNLARGKSRSIKPGEALATLRSLEERGYEEAVLTGVNISLYAGIVEDREPLDLAGLLEYLLSGTGRIRLRLSSIEPEIYSPAFIRAISHERVRPHFHFPLQSGSPFILSRMKRIYSPEEAEEGIRLLRSAKGDPFLGCDIITGFPGESRDEFEKSYDFCQNLGFIGIHVFPFSRRPGTEAWDFNDRVTEKEAGLRAEKLMGLAQKNRETYIKRWIGKTVEAVVEESGEPDSVQALSENYLKLLVTLKDRPKPKAGSLIRCRILQGPAPERFDAMAEVEVRS